MAACEKELDKSRDWFRERGRVEGGDYVKELEKVEGQRREKRAQDVEKRENQRGEESTN